MSIYKYKPKPMTKGQYEALEMVLSYMENDERNHWESVGKPPAGHIYNYIQRLEDYKYQCMVLDKAKGKRDDDDWPIDRADD